MLFEIFVGLVLFISFISVMVNQAPNERNNKKDNNIKK